MGDCIVILRELRATEYANPFQFVENPTQLEGNTKTVRGVFLLTLSPGSVDVSASARLLRRYHRTVQPERDFQQGKNYKYDCAVDDCRMRRITILAC